jgi:hypothetical protein
MAIPLELKAVIAPINPAYPIFAKGKDPSSVLHYKIKLEL